MAAKSSARTRRDRWADWAVVGVLLAALLLGWGVQTLAIGRCDTYSDVEAGLTVRYPQSWLLKADENLAFQAVNPASGDFGTTYRVRAWPIQAAADVTPTLALALNNASLSRAREGTAYRLFDIVEGKEIDGQPSMEATYVYVHEGSDLFVQRMPVVVQGLDIAVARGDKAFVFSLLAATDEYEDAERAFRQFVKSAEIR